MATNWRLTAAISLALAGGLTEHAMALPVFQVYSPDATAATMGPDEDTWFVSDNTFDLIVVSSFRSDAVKLEDITLIASVPEDEVGTITVTPIEGTDGPFTVKSDFLPSELKSNHYPFQDNVSDFWTFVLDPSVRDRPTTESTLHNYNADDGGSITATSGFGFETAYMVAITGFTSVHFDVYGMETSVTGTKNLRTSWDYEMNPGSHDVTAHPTHPVPLPAAALGGFALFGAIGARGLAKRRRAGNVA